MLDSIEMPPDHTMGRQMSRESLVARPIHERRLTRQASRAEVLGGPTPCSTTAARRLSLTRQISQHCEPLNGLGTLGYGHGTVRDRILTRQASKEVLTVTEDNKTTLLRRERGFSRTFSQELTALSSQFTRQRLLSRTFSQEDLDEHLPILLRSLRELLKDDQECLRKDDEFLTKFLRVKKYNVERAHALIRSYYSQIKRNQDILMNVRPSRCMSIFQENMAVILKGKARDRSTIAFIRVGMWDTKKFTLQDLMRSYIFIAEQAIRDRDTQLYGVTAIVDLKNLGLSHCRQMTPKELKRVIFGAQDGFPVKLAGVHAINHPYIFYSVWYVAQRLLKEKLRQRVHMHSDLASLHTHFDREMLPSCLGGPLDLHDAMDHDVINTLLKEDRLLSEFYS